MRALDEIPYIWDLVFRVSTRKELKTLCEVCKLFNDLATPILYRSVVLRKSKTTGENWHVLPSDVDDPAKARDLSFSLFYRLLHDDKIRTWTRELTLAKIYDKADLAIVNQKLNHPDEPLADLVKQMPNLGNI
ncbi:uncharacterized protein N7479_003308 [Penicillium vulpinum]|uniref:uncharacterized protein n=1 Tax=Penicillium vulpinum TaxID=29845 RepID=UPI0025475ACE|nr:uncharacterized protein N7479_003308 [Penicillium vulpinum]KAJ5963432.1 hypothetical protein N7479_003308 [Penicillium vulpinum]